MPPHSFCEWAVGQNVSFRRKAASRASRPRRVVSVDVETDDESGTDTLKVTYPRTGNAKEKHRPPRQTSPGQEAEAEAETGTNQEANGGEVTVDENPSPDCPCDSCVLELQKIEEEGKHSQAHCQGDQVNDPATVHAKHKATKAKIAKAKAVQSGAKNSNRKSRGVENRQEPDSEAGTTDGTTDSTGGETETESEVDAESDSASDEEAPKKGKKGKNKKNKQVQKNREGSPGRQGKKGKKRKDSNKKKHSESSRKNEDKKSGKRTKGKATEKDNRPISFYTDTASSKEARTETQKAPESPRPLPEFGQGRGILPSRSRVLQVEHAVETPEDPRPNAFFDHRNSTMRVFHGPTYGNPQAMVYPPGSYYHPAPHPIGIPYSPGFGYPYVPPHTPSGAPPSPHPPNSGQWFQGHGTTTVGQPPDMPPVPDFAADFDQGRYMDMLRAEGWKPPGPSGTNQDDSGGQSNIAPAGNPAAAPKPDQGSDESARRSTTNINNLGDLRRDDALRMAQFLQDHMLNQREQGQPKTDGSQNAAKSALPENNVTPDPRINGSNSNAGPSDSTAANGGGTSPPPASPPNNNNNKTTANEDDWAGEADMGWSGVSQGPQGPEGGSNSPEGAGASARPPPGSWPAGGNGNSAKGPPSFEGPNNVGWRDQSVAQSSGGAYDDDENEKKNGNGNRGDNASGNSQRQ
ncbi:hypothetical protein GGS23DRAFT_457648 [Durotheca rogersii]|uniref:uncharacterized protein n=1 Tax=Durotheca rogersii TaxID=419775 RepID=UPI00221E6F8C|nr:uncharacterized protein GGS23DRAFT_457648 [Durotheca rogersii]KAI5864639.1 hypothetical protein GGS23DRAFT_457648 [Durotheca rogersii]